MAESMRGVRVMEEAVTPKVGSGRKQGPAGPGRGQEPRGSDTRSLPPGQPLPPGGFCTTNFYFVPAASVQWSQFPPCPGIVLRPGSRSPSLMSLESLGLRNGTAKELSPET